jgi:predicted acetyltransferase
MNIDVAPASFFEKPILERLYQLYDYDFSEFDQSDVDANGLFIIEYLNTYWQEDGRYPFLVRVDGKLAGFVLVSRLPGKGAQGEEVHSIAEFFVMRKYRGLGVGRWVAFQVFDRFPGEWRVEEMSVNLPAQAFWRRVIGEYTAGAYVERIRDDEEWQGPEQIFKSIKRPK